ncbi:acyltransferase [Pedobacter sp. MC2016-14]|uniref:acyltransferase family protein n=1 Tax=Pedobacter sp. MC2016-14 TaxID=2897327 RepID=UPI001E2BBDF4|nr:acyltransferase family protein [Pedobacter sp. MC2016-14]MCD0486847.1 acyltransferase [Pedobacter sp. MC2016-14]
MVKDSIKFRYDINALRAIAVLGVVLFHFKVPYLTGGFAGVDVFFVISGYLMTKIINNGILGGSFSFAEFYGKRLKRIVPALVFLVILVALCAFFVYFPDDYALTLKNGLASLLFLSNIYYWQNAGYFDASSDTNIFLHTWSLSVEWQFYLLYPLILLALNRLFSHKLKFLWVFVLLNVAFCCLALYTTSIAPSTSFYFLHTRAWEMLAGGLAFFFERSGTDAAKAGLRKLTALVGYAAIILCFFFLDSSMAWPGAFTLLPVVATVFILMANWNDFRGLRLTAVQWPGKISYSLYLWHWPVYVFAQYLGLEMTPVVLCLLLLTAATLGWCSYRYLEPLKFSSAGIMGFSAGLLVLLGLIAFFQLNKVAFSASTLKIAGYGKAKVKDLVPQYQLGTCFVCPSCPGAKPFNRGKCLDLRKGKKNILLIGDSHGAHFSASLREAFAERNVNLLQATASGCFPVINMSGRAHCTEVRDFVYDQFIVENADAIDGVILSANWVDAYEGRRAELLSDIKATLSFLKSYKIPVVLIGQNETYTIPYPTIAAKEHQYHISIWKHFLKANSVKIDGLLKAKLKEVYIPIINTDSVPGISPNAVPYISDDHHLSKFGADKALAKVLASPIFKKFMASDTLISR